MYIYTQGDDSGPSVPAIPPPPAESAPAATATEGTTTIDDLDFSDMKKKKKSTKKKANFDLEAFEKELNDSKAKSASSKPEEDEEDGLEPDGSHLDNIDETELGDDPFAQPADAPVGVDAGNEAWLKSDRDYTYQEVRRPFSLVVPPPN